MDASIVVAVVALLGVVATAIFAYLGQKQQNSSTAESTLADIARSEIEEALRNQRARLESVFTEHRREIDLILASHSREIDALRAQHNEEIRALTAKIDQLTQRAEAAEKRADLAEERAEVSADHARRCDAALAELLADHESLKRHIEEMKQ